jgi:hypothetical protein
MLGASSRCEMTLGFSPGLKKMALDLSQNGLSGPFPEDIEKCLTLQMFEVHDNAFTGELPAGFWLLLDLRAIRAQNNRFTGRLPELQNTSARAGSARQQQLLRRDTSQRRPGSHHVPVLHIRASPAGARKRMPEKSDFGAARKLSGPSSHGLLQQEPVSEAPILPCAALAPDAVARLHCSALAPDAVALLPCATLTRDHLPPDQYHLSPAPVSTEQRILDGRIHQPLPRHLLLPTTPPRPARETMSTVKPITTSGLCRIDER